LFSSILYFHLYFHRPIQPSDLTAQRVPPRIRRPVRLLLPHPLPRRRRTEIHLAFAGASPFRRSQSCRRQRRPTSRVARRGLLRAASPSFRRRCALSPSLPSLDTVSEISDTCVFLRVHLYNTHKCFFPSCRWGLGNMREYQFTY
jgi:hypothetical protein